MRCVLLLCEGEFVEDQEVLKDLPSTQCPCCSSRLFAVVSPSPFYELLIFLLKNTKAKKVIYLFLGNFEGVCLLLMGVSKVFFQGFLFAFLLRAEGSRPSRGLVSLAFHTWSTLGLSTVLFRVFFGVNGPCAL